MKSEEKPKQENKEEKEESTAGDYCINRNSAGGTCGHRESEHGVGGGACNVADCGCSSFEPNT